MNYIPANNSSIALLQYEQFLSLIRLEIYFVLDITNVFSRYWNFNMHIANIKSSLAILEVTYEIRHYRFLNKTCFLALTFTTVHSTHKGYSFPWTVVAFLLHLLVHWHNFQSDLFIPMTSFFQYCPWQDTVNFTLQHDHHRDKWNWAQCTFSRQAHVSEFECFCKRLH